MLSVALFGLLICTPELIEFGFKFKCADQRCRIRLRISYMNYLQMPRAVTIRDNTITRILCQSEHKIHVYVVSERKIMFAELRVNCD